MNRLNRRRFMALSSAGAASAVLVACGNPKPSSEQVNPTQIPDVAGAPPTLAPIASTPGAEEGNGEQPSGGEQASGGGGGAETVKVEAYDIGFDPSEFSIAPGGTIEMDNTGVLEHDLAVDDWGGVLIGPFGGGESGSYTVPEDAQPGETFEFYCTIPGHKEAGMVGTLTIAEAGAGGGEEEATEEEGGETAATTDGEGGATEFTIKAIDIDFDPKEFTIAPGGTITLDNEGVLEHDFVVDEWDGFIIGPLAGGDSDSGTVPEDIEPGEYEFYCSIPGHKEAGMVGKVTVAAAGEGGGEAAGGAAEEEASTEASPAASPEASPVAAEAGGDEEGATEFTVKAIDIDFDPKEFTIARGGTITLDNEGVLEHDFAVDEWDNFIIGPLKGGESDSGTVPDDVEPGEYEYYCTIPGHKEAGMVGKVTVV